MFKVIFTYDPNAEKWESIVEGARDEIEARQGFSAVVLTLRELETRLLNKTKVIPLLEGTYSIVPAVAFDPASN